MLGTAEQNFRSFQVLDFGLIGSQPSSVLVHLSACTMPHMSLPSNAVGHDQSQSSYKSREVLHNIKKVFGTAT